MFIKLLFLGAKVLILHESSDDYVNIRSVVSSCKFQVPGSRFKVQGLRFKVPGSRFKVLGVGHALIPKMRHET